MWAQEYNHGLAQLVQIESALAAAFTTGIQWI